MRDELLVGAGLVAGPLLLARPRRLAQPAAVPDDVTVSVVVPARDEARTLPILLRSLRELDPAPAEVIVVDDGSTDGTDRVAVAHGARVLSTSPPPGWAGKPWACHEGARLASGTHLLFLDADTSLAPDALARLLAEHAAHGGLVSVQPHHRTVRAYEQLSAFFNLAAVMGSGVCSPVRRGGDRVAFGPCLLTSTDDYLVAGGHAAVRASVVEDVHLAQRYRERGLPVRCLPGGETVRFRMYPAGLGQLVAGWTKNIATGAGASPAWALAGTVAWVSSCVAVALAMVAGTWSWLAGGTAPVVPLLAWLVVAAQLRWMLGRVGSWHIWTALAFPVPLVAFVAVFARSAFLVLAHGEVTWRSRRVPVTARTGR